ncbi:hypothetical protein DFR29_11427 [Tahibacter aquaticus]|uniref:Urease accessory protein UreH-like transmembrane domain-containing protein n=1 Tax=Tahibacter aquaticus TaxID=520092 RepID=A0A4R6YQ73_9GAMM|nr:sulfite exporter TauE/SafE family protein [Tahibacter aquaticus]TDR39976.1 hypothetical protein DFR29_11427 [Tahibacter aquaticus]
MPIDFVALAAALLSGLFGSLHCAAMCGGIATGLGSCGGQARGSFGVALRVNAGRLLGYVLAGLLVGALGAGLLQLVDASGLGTLLRVLSGAVLVAVALRLLDVHKKYKLPGGAGAGLWRWLAPLQRRLLPATTPARQWLLGMLWGWLPCGLSSSLLLAAWLQADWLNAALTMAAFGLGTLPLMLPLTWSGVQLGRRLAQPAWRRSAAALVLSAGVLTMTAPWLLQVPALQGVLGALGCRGH